MRKLLCLLLVLVLLLSIFGCGKEDKPLYGLILSGNTGYQQKIAEGYCQAVNALGGEVITITADTLQAQQAALEELTKKGVVGIAIRPIAPEGLEDALQSARLAGICTVAVDMSTEKADYFINHASPDAAARALLDEIHRLTGGDGSFALLTYGVFSGANVYVSVMKLLTREEKYQNLKWVQTQYCDEEASLADALAEIPACDVICCTQSDLMPLLSQTLKGTSTKLTGLAVPSAMSEQMTQDGPCEGYCFWDFAAAGTCAAQLINAVTAGNLTKDAQSFTAGDGTVYPIYEDMLADRYLYSGPPLRIGLENAADWADIA